MTIHDLSLLTAYWNINGASNKLKDAEFLLYICKYDICFLSETWLNTDISLESKVVENLNANNKVVIKNLPAKKHSKKHGRHSGGILAIIDKKLRKGITVVNRGRDYGIWLKLNKHFFSIPNDKYICGSYIPPRSSPYTIPKIFDKLDEEITELSGLGKILIIGDMNARVGNQLDYVPADKYNATDDMRDITPPDRHSMDHAINTYGRSLLNLCRHNDLLLLNGRTLGDIPGACTCHKNNGSSLVDHCMTSLDHLEDILYFTVEVPSHYSDHCLIKTRIKINKIPDDNEQLILKPLPCTYKWDKSSSDKFKNALKEVQFQKELCAFNNNQYKLDQNGTNDIGSDLLNLISKTAERCLVKRKGQYKGKHKNAHKSKNIALDKYYSNLKKELRTLGENLLKYPRDPYLRGKYFSLKKNLKGLMKKAEQEQKNLILNKIHSLEEKKPDAFWKLVNEIKGKKASHAPIDPDSLYKHFRELHAVQPNKLFDYKFEKLIQTKLKNIDKTKWVDFLDKSVTEKEVLNTCKSLKNKKASGPDGICNEMLKACMPTMLPSFCKVFNHILHSECFPKPWSLGHIVALFKSGDYLDPGNYRGLTITSSLGKLFTKIMNIRLINFLELNKLISVSQTAFKPKQRTSDHILVLKTICDVYKSKRKAVYLCFVDLTKAFDTVNRTLMLYKLYKHNLSSKFINIVQSMYEDLHACIKTKVGCTEGFPVDIGTRQGCNLSPSLFNLFMNDLPNVLESEESGYVILGQTKVNCLMYADDIVLLSTSFDGLNKSIKILENYCNKWQLKINIKKTKIMVCNKRFRDDYNFKMYNQSIEIVKSFVYLGIEVASSGSFKLAITRNLNKATRAYYSLVRDFSHYNGTKPRILQKLFDSMVMPVLLYGCEIWAIHGWRTQTKMCIEQHLFSGNHCFERLNAKMCKAALGVSRYTPNLTAKAELGAYPLFGKIIKHTMSYWQHIIASPQDSLVHKALEVSVDMDRHDKTSYYSRIKNLLEFLNAKDSIYPVKRESIKKLSNYTMKLFENLYETFYFKNLLPTGKSVIYAQIKHTYRYERYLDFDIDRSLVRNITAIRTSAHCLPVEKLRKKGLKKEERMCNLCSSGFVGDEMHVMAGCSNVYMKRLREELLEKLTKHNDQFKKFTLPSLIKILLIANDRTSSCIFSIFLKKMFFFVNANY